ncbi:MAG: hypothetical protein LQ351_003627 [Letrouitia transgressa]|nr:MAG: hypothetical protein LQ351_003627 [Letrouitia transgressa]
MSLKNVVIIGAGGNLGPSILEALEKNPAYTITVVTRKGSSSTFSSHIKVFRIDDSFPSDQLAEAFKGQDVVINLSPPVDVDQHKTVIDIAAQAGIKRYLPGEFGSDTENKDFVALVPVFHAKLEILNYLKSKESTGLTWTGVANGAFFDWGLNVGFLGFDLKSQSAKIYDGGNVKFSTTVLPTIGKAVDGVLSHPGETANKTVFVQSFTTTQNEILAALEKATGKKWAVTNLSAEKTRQEGLEKLGKGDFSGIGDTIVGAVYSGNEGSNFLNHKKLSNDLFGLKEENVDEAVKKVVSG